MSDTYSLYRQALSVVDELKYCLSEVDGITPPMIELLDPNISEIYSKSSRAKVITTIHSFIHSLTHSFTHSFIHLFIHLFIHSFIYHLGGVSQLSTVITFSDITW